MTLVPRRGLPVLLGLTLTAGAVVVASPAHAGAGILPPTAEYALDSAAIWTGQHVTLTETAATDDTTPPEALVRTVNWGDSTVETVPSTASWQHTYAAVGSYTVQVTVNDGELDGTGVFPAGATVGVTTAPGSFAWQKPTVYTYPGYQAQATMLASGLPAGSRTWTTWGDGETSLLRSGSATATVPHWYPMGTWAPQVTLQNAQGKASPRTAATLSVKSDTTPPSAAVTVPAYPNRASSWALVNGRSSDTQSGADLVVVEFWKWNSTGDYYFDFDSRRWVKLTSSSQYIPPSVNGVFPVDSAGNWHVYTSGVTKGWTFEVDYYGIDKAGNDSAWKHTSYYLNS